MIMRFLRFLVKKLFIFVFVGATLSAEKKLNLLRLHKLTIQISKELDVFSKQIDEAHSLEEIYFLEQKFSETTKSFDAKYQNVFDLLEKKRNRLESDKLWKV